MAWENLLFAHWAVDPEILAPFIPEHLELETWEGKAWIGIVPFLMRNTHLRGLPGLFGTANFPELNVRTYVRPKVEGGKAGVWFFSLDATSPLAVRMARFTFHLPYMDARMRSMEQNGFIYYSSKRTHAGAPPAKFEARYRPVGDVYKSTPGSLEHWLTERYCLYSADSKGNLSVGEIHHVQWPLQRAELEIRTNTMTEGLGLKLDGTPDTLHFAKWLEVVAWAIRRIP